MSNNPPAFPRTGEALDATIAALLDRLATLEAEREAARARVVEAFAIIDAAPELNMGNYDHDDVDRLNSAMIDAHQILEPLAARTALATAEQESGS